MDFCHGVTFIEGKGHSSDCYLVRGKVNVLIDTGVLDNLDNLLSHIDCKVDLIINTHCHYDHVECNKALVDKFGCKVAAHALDAPYIESGDREHTCAFYFEKKLSGVKVDVILHDGDRIEGTDLEVIHTPGHSMGSICLLDTKRKILFSGDTIFARGSVGRTDLPGSDFMKLKESIDKLTLFDFEVIFPGHGDAHVGDGREYVRNVFLSF